MSFDTASVLRSLPFLILLGLGLANLLSGAALANSRFGTSFYPVTGQLLRSIHGSYQFMLYLIVAYYAGEVVWRERDARVAEPSDASPVPNWLPLFAKMGALFAVVLVFLAAGVLACIGYQLWHGYTNLELGVYLRGMDPKLMQWAGGDIRKVNVDPAKRAKLYAKYGATESGFCDAARSA